MSNLFRNIISIIQGYLLVAFFMPEDFFESSDDDNKLNNLKGKITPPPQF